MTPLVTLLIAAAISGHPTKIACDTDTNPGPVKPPPGYVVEAWTPVGGDTIHMAPVLCAGLFAPIGNIRFAQSYRVLLHEAAHARGIAVEACAELYAWEHARNFLYTHYFFDPWLFWLSDQVVKQIEAETRLRPANYQPQLCGKGIR